MKRLLVLALTLVGFVLSVVQATMWNVMTKQQNSEVFAFDPTTTIIEFKMKPLGEGVADHDLHFNLVSRMYDDSGNMQGVVSFLYKMEGEEVTRSLLRLGAKVKENTLKYCYDRRILRGKLPRHLLYDIVSGNVVTIDKTKVPNFERNRVCQAWQDLVQSNTITRAAVGLWDYNKNTYDKIAVYYRVVTLDIPAATDEPITYGSPQVDNIEVRPTSTSEPGTDDEKMGEPSSGDICSMYPNGVLDTFNKESVHYDMMCYHVLAANFGSGSTPAWFIYGAYDDFDRKRSLRALTFYVGAKSFEIQRGWMVNNDGEKFLITEGEEVELPDSGCSILFKNFYLTVDCRPGGYPFTAHYDGYMLGHIELFERTDRDIGLCFKNSNGRRVNWQLSNQLNCESVSPDIEGCETQSANCDVFEDACDDSLARACREMSCGDVSPTSEQICSLSLAKKRKCQFAGSRDTSAITACPKDGCLRKFFVLGTGCPQDSFFAGCPIENYINLP